MQFDCLAFENGRVLRSPVVRSPADFATATPPTVQRAPPAACGPNAKSTDSACWDGKVAGGGGGGSLHDGWGGEDQEEARGKGEGGGADLACEPDLACLRGEGGGLFEYPPCYSETPSVSSAGCASNQERAINSKL